MRFGKSFSDLFFLQENTMQLSALEAENRALSRVLTDDTSILADDGSSGSTIALYRMDLSVGDALVGSKFLDQAALTDTVLVGAGEWGKSFALDGSAAVVITADGKTCYYTLVAVLINDVPTLYAIFGAEALDGNEVEPTECEIIDALIAAGIAGYEPRYGLILNEVLVQRAGGAMTLTAKDPAAVDALKEKRLAGTLNRIVLS
jgi:hypothetical protein